MNPTDSIPTLTGPDSAAAFTTEQREYISGFLASLALLRESRIPDAPAIEQDQQTRETLSATPPADERVFGVPLDDLTKQERWKHAEHGLDSWHRIAAHAEVGSLPDDENTFRFRYHGLFFVGPTQESFMLRCRIPAGELTSAQLTGLAAIADDFGNRQAAVTTRSNLQIREIGPASLPAVLSRLQSLGLTSKGSGVDNVRNITASPTAGFDPQELIDTRPFAHALHEFILNHRDLYDLPRKFNVAFEGGGAIDTVADTNDIGFMAVRVPAIREHGPATPTDGGPSPTVPAGVASPASGISVRDGSEVEVKPGVYFRVELAGISGHKQLARDSGLVVTPSQAVAVASAMIRVFIENGDRTDRKKARLKYLIDRWGIDRFITETQAKLPFPLVRFGHAACLPRPSSIKHAHIGVHPQKQPGWHYVGVVVPVGMLTSRQMRGMAALAHNYGSSHLRLTPWQNLLIPDIPTAFVETVKRQLVRLGLHHEATHASGGLVACTGNRGCKYAATDTKGDALQLAKQLPQAVTLDLPINIHLTGCPHSCAQHYVGDIGLQGVKIGPSGDEGYHVVFGGGTGSEAGIGREVFKGVPAADIPGLIARVLKNYMARRKPGENFTSFTRRHAVSDLQQM